MNRTLLLIVGTAFLSSCGDTTKGKTHQAESYHELVQRHSQSTPKSDTIALGFRIGAGQDETERRMVQLIADNRIGSDTTWTIQTLDVPNAHRYDFYLNDSITIPLYFSHGYFDGKLSSLTLFGEHNALDATYDFSDIKDWMVKKLGAPDYDTAIDDNHHRYYWFDGYKETLVAESGPYLFAIEYKDLRTEVQKQKLQDLIDSSKKIVNHEKANDSKNDIK
jgi:hypothetical protein